MIESPLGATATRGEADATGSVSDVSSVPGAHTRAANDSDEKCEADLNSTAVLAGSAEIGAPAVVPGSPLSGSEPGPEPAATSQTTTHRFADYELLQVISRDELGVVFKARQVSVDRVVALKLVMGEQWLREGDLQRFYREATAIADLDHPSIVPIFDVGQHGGQHFVSMGFVEGHSLAERMAPGVFSSRDTAALVSELAEALAVAHSKGVVHGNLTPKRIVFNARGQAKLSGFGVTAQRQGDDGAGLSRQLLDSPGYLAPEQVNEEREIDPRTDVYGLGGILYLMLTGLPPFRGATLVETLTNIREKEPIPPRELSRGSHAMPRALEAICLKCLQKRPDDRYKTTVELAAELGRWLEGKALKKTHRISVARLKSWGRHLPAAAGVLRGPVVAFALVPFVLAAIVCWAPQSKQAAAVRAMANYNAPPGPDSATRVELARAQAELARLQRIPRPTGPDYVKRVDLAKTQAELARLQRIHETPGLDSATRVELAKVLAELNRLYGILFQLSLP